MTDAPFGRTDSEDDIVEEYDDVLTIKASCLKNRTALEKVLMVVVVLALAVITGLTVGLTRPVPVPGIALSIFTFGLWFSFRLFDVVGFLCFLFLLFLFCVFSVCVVGGF